MVLQALIGTYEQGSVGQHSEVVLPSGVVGQGGGQGQLLEMVQQKYFK